MKKILLCWVVCMLGVLTTMAQSLSGRVALKDSVDCPIATVRINELGIGTTAKLDGTYTLTGITPGKHVVEFSYVGYQTVMEEVTFAAGEQKQLDVLMEQAPIMLGTVFITPDGSDAASFILNKVWAQADSRYKTVGDFKFHTTMVLSYQDFDMFQALLDCLPAFPRRLLNMMVRMAGYKGVMDLLFAYPHLDVQTVNGGTCTKGKYKWGKEEVKRCNVSLTDKEKQTLNKMKMDDDLYKQVYVDNILRKKKTDTKLKGSYEEAGKVVYIIEGKNGDDVATMYVLEDSWDVVKYVAKSGGNTDVWELRRSLGNLYMPVSYNSTMTLISKSPKELQELLQEYDAEKDKMQQEDLNRKSKRVLDGLDGFINRIKARGRLDCRANSGVTISYSK